MAHLRIEMKHNVFSIGEAFGFFEPSLCDVLRRHCGQNVILQDLTPLLPLRPEMPIKSEMKKLLK